MSQLYINVEKNHLNSCLFLMYVLNCSVVPSSAAPWTVAHQAPLSMRFSRQDYWSGFPFPPPGDLPNTEIEPVSLPLALPGKASSLKSH